VGCFGTRRLFFTDSAHNFGVFTRRRPVIGKQFTLQDGPTHRVVPFNQVPIGLYVPMMKEAYVTGRRILAIPGVLALVFATTIGVGIMPSGASKYPPSRLPPGLHCGHVNGFPRGGFTVQITITGAGFHGQPKIISDDAGTKVSVIHDHGNVLVVLVSVNYRSHRGTHTFKITNPDRTSCQLHYTSK